MVARINENPWQIDAGLIRTFLQSLCNLSNIFKNLVKLPKNPHNDVKAYQLHEKSLPKESDFRKFPNKSPQRNK